MESFYEYGSKRGFWRLNELFKEKKISFKKNLSCSVPNRLIIFFDGLQKEIIQNKEEIRGPSTNAPEKALEGFLRSNQLSKDQIFKKQIEKGEFYFYNGKYPWQPCGSNVNVIIINTNNGKRIIENNEPTIK